MGGDTASQPVRWAVIGIALLVPRLALADEGGVSFWLPGMFGSLATVPQQEPGWSVATMYYHTSVSAGSDVAFAREFELGRVPANLTGSLSATLNGTGDLGIVAPNYAFATPILGGQASVGMMAIVGNTSASLAGTLSGSIGGVPFMRSDNISSSITGVGDLYPIASLKWNQGVNNYMT